jgi:folate-dependent phosphoribosylglycinamide formyltransferase PurN
MKVLILSPYPQALIPAIIDNGDTVECCDDELDTAMLASIRPDWIVSYGYRFLIRPPILDQFPGRIINLHVSLLPWNRGADPNFWSWFEGSPKGVTIHQIDAGMDTGPILAQRELALDGLSETLATSYDRLRSEVEDLFKQSWSGIAKGQIKALAQQARLPVHRSADKTGILNSLPLGWNIRACIIDRLRSVSPSRWSELTDSPACPCPLGPCPQAESQPN